MEKVSSQLKIEQIISSRRPVTANDFNHQPSLYWHHEGTWLEMNLFKLMNLYVVLVSIVVSICGEYRLAADEPLIEPGYLAALLGDGQETRAAIAAELG